MDKKKTYYVVFEGGEGTYKTSTAKAVVERLREAGYSVLDTKEPGTPHLPITMKLREIMLNNEYDDQLCIYGREFISQAIRQIHLEKLIRPAYASGEYDFIIQDRGILSGLIYARACGAYAAHTFTPDTLGQRGIAGLYDIYDHTMVFRRKNHSLSVALGAKQEFNGGDAMESRGDEFHKKITDAFNNIRGCDHKSHTLDCIDVDKFDGKPEDLITTVIYKILNEKAFCDSI